MPPFENNLRQRKENIWLEENTNCIKKNKKTKNTSYTVQKVPGVP